MNIDNLKTLISLTGENEWLEFKQDNYAHEDIGEYISALSNSACLHSKQFGYLIFGIEDGTKSLVGTTFKPKSYKIGNEELENWLLRLLDPGLDFKIIEINDNEKIFVVIQIDATTSKPVSFKGIEYIRVGSYKKKLKDYPEKERKIWKLCSRITFETENALLDLTDDDILRLLDYSTFFEMMEIPLPSNKNAILDKLMDNLFINSKGDKYNITNLGAILLAKDLDEFPTLARKAVRLIIYKGKNKILTKREKVFNNGYAISFGKIYSYIFDLLPTNEELKRALRHEAKLYPIDAIRELVANALIHQDFEVGGTSPLIEVYDDRMEISNPGTALIDPLRFLDSDPKSRNERLASTMRKLRICEERGSGIDKVVYQTELYQLPAPKFLQETSYVKTIIYSSKKLNDMDKIDKIRAAYLHACLKYVSNEFMTNKSLRERFGVKEKNYSIISRIISDAIDAHLIKLKDPKNKSRKHFKYIPIWA